MRHVNSTAGARRTSFETRAERRAPQDEEFLCCSNHSPHPEEPRSGVSKDVLRARWSGIIPAALASLAILSACGQKDRAAAEPLAAATEKVEAATVKTGAGPAMWVVSDEDSTIYLFGTFHILPSSLNWKTPAFDAAMAQTPATMIEVDTKSPAAQAKMNALVKDLGLNPPGVTLSETLGAERAAHFAAVAERYGVPMASLEPMKPWLAMLTLAVLVMQKEGFESESGAEAAILARAATQGDEIAHLESAEYQIRALASLDENEILADFDSSLEQFDNFDAYAKRVLTAWRTGDVAVLETETLDPLRESAPGAFKTLITQRNRNWTGEIDKMLNGDDDWFIAVGAGHLIGEDSVIDMLEEKGRDVRRVQ